MKPTQVADINSSNCSSSAIASAKTKSSVALASAKHLQQKQQALEQGKAEKETKQRSKSWKLGSWLFRRQKSNKSLQSPSHRTIVTRTSSRSYDDYDDENNADAALAVCTSVVDVDGNEQHEVHPTTTNPAGALSRRQPSQHEEDDEHDITVRDSDWPILEVEITTHSSSASDCIHGCSKGQMAMTVDDDDDDEAYWESIHDHDPLEQLELSSEHGTMASCTTDNDNVSCSTGRSSRRHSRHRSYERALALVDLGRYNDALDELEQQNLQKLNETALSTSTSAAEGGTEATLQQPQEQQLTSDAAAAAAAAGPEEKEQDVNGDEGQDEEEDGSELEIHSKMLQAQILIRVGRLSESLELCQSLVGGVDRTTDDEVCLVENDRIPITDRLNWLYTCSRLCQSLHKYRDAAHYIELEAQLTAKYFADPDHYALATLYHDIANIHHTKLGNLKIALGFYQKALIVETRALKKLVAASSQHQGHIRYGGGGGGGGGGGQDQRTQLYRERKALLIQIQDTKRKIGRILYEDCGDLENAMKVSTTKTKYTPYADYSMMST